MYITRQLADISAFANVSKRKLNHGIYLPFTLILNYFCEIS